MSRKGYYVFALLAAGILLAACGMEDPGSGEPGSTRTIYGTSQKGPFMKGTEVTLYGMDENLQQTGAHFSTKIDNDRGEYSLKKIKLDDRYAWLNANGYYIDEMTGEKSIQKISLNSLVDLQDLDHVNINVLTHLSFDRIRYLVKQGKTVDEAKRQAEAEVMNAFGFSEETEAFDQLDILNGGDGDAKLLAVSLMMLTAENNADVTNRMASIALDIETDGVWDDTTLIALMKKDVSMANHDGVYNAARRNLVNLGVAEVPDFQKYLDQFLIPWDSAWGLWFICGNQDEVRYVPTSNLFESADFGYSYFATLNSSGELVRGYICRDGIWKNYGRMAEVDTTGKYGTMVDKRDGHVYRTLNIKMNDGKTVTWMVSFLEYEGWYDKSSTYIPGRGCHYDICESLYPLDYETCITEDFRLEIKSKILNKEYVQGICPDGWHLPQVHEWEQLEASIKDDSLTQDLLEYLKYLGEENKESYFALYRPVDPLILDTDIENKIENFKLYYLMLGGDDYRSGVRCVKD